jgi:hypothetical protein
MMLFTLGRRLLPLALVLLLGWAFVTDAGGLRTWVNDVLVDYVSDSLRGLSSSHG